MTRTVLPRKKAPKDPHALLLCLVLPLALAASAGSQPPQPPPSPAPALPIDAMAPAGSFAGSGESCQPPVPALRFDGEESAEITARLKTHFEDDAAREKGDWKTIDWERVAREDLARRNEIIILLAAGKITRAESLYHAAMVFQHGNCPEHFELTAELALRAIELGHEKANWLYAAGTDRYLMNLGKAQKYGTQFSKTADGVWRLYEVDPTVSDEERARFNVPSLSVARERARKLNEKGQL